MFSPGSKRQKEETVSLISSVSDKAVPLNQYANDCAVEQSCQIARIPSIVLMKNGEKKYENGGRKMDMTWRMRR